MNSFISMIKILLKKETLLSVVVFLFSPLKLFAREVNLPGLGSDPELPEYVAYLFDLGIKIAGALAFAVIVFGGAHYVFSFGVGKITNKGKEWVKAGVTGLFVIMISFIIMNTINPDLVNLGLTDLVRFDFSETDPFSRRGGRGPETIVFEEFPVGKAIENTLSRTIDCYEFDFRGDPIPGEEVSGGDYGPTHMNHDRVQCIIYLAEAVEKKAEIFKYLSGEIARLMEECSCEGPPLICETEDRCDDLCDYHEIVSDPALCNEEACDVDCLCECVSPGCDPCPFGIRDIFESGDEEEGHICIDGRLYEGLDEFRTEHEGSGLLDIVEKEITIENKKVTIMDVGEWEKLRLVDQIKYLKEKIKDEAEKIEEDLDVLVSMGSALDSSYLSINSATFVKRMEETDSEKEVIEIEKNFQDPFTNEDLEGSQYCLGYQYANSKNWHTCRNICPGDVESDRGCYSRCPLCPHNDLDCLERQKECMKECFVNSHCSFDFSNFKQCLIGYREDCVEQCEEILEEEEENNNICPVQESKKEELYQNCLEICNDDSETFITYLNDEEQPILGDEVAFDVEFKSSVENCYINLPSLRQCAEEHSGDIVFFQDCFRLISDYGCNYASDQHAGYLDCAKDPKPSSDLVTNSLSSLWLITHPHRQLGPSERYPGWFLSRYDIDEEEGLNIYPETAKCPLNSPCPSCPYVDEEEICPINNIKCSEIREICAFVDCSQPRYIEERNCLLRHCSEVESSRLEVNTTCKDFGYDGDPLTFYVRSDYWEEDDPQEPLGREWDCSKRWEVPVGETSNETERWVKAFVEIVNSFVEETEEMVEYIESIGEEEDYCECDSLCDPEGEIEEGACDVPCEFETFSIPVLDEEGNIIGEEWVCTCILGNCMGNPCQRMINLLRGKAEDEDCPEGVEFLGVGYLHEIIREKLYELKGFDVKVRSDLLKKLSYSRKIMDEGSLISFGRERAEETKMLNCEIILDNLITPIASRSSAIYYQKEEHQGFCYGRDLGRKLRPRENLMNNWFFCEKIPSD